jgi:hypothetical protein
MKIKRKRLVLLDSEFSEEQYFNPHDEIRVAIYERFSQIGFTLLRKTVIFYSQRSRFASFRRCSSKSGETFESANSAKQLLSNTGGSTSRRCLSLEFNLQLFIIFD